MKEAKNWDYISNAIRANNLITIFGYTRKDAWSNEAILKYLLRVWAPLVPTNPITNNPIKIHQFIFYKRGTNNIILSSTFKFWMSLMLLNNLCCSFSHWKNSTQLLFVLKDKIRHLISIKRLKFTCESVTLPKEQDQAIKNSNNSCYTLIPIQIRIIEGLGNKMHML